jgi:uncharacterized membrane protein (DUF373 family)
VEDSVTNKILTLTSEFTDLRSKWKTLSIYERFEQTVVSVLTLVIAVIIALATWQLLLHTLSLVKTHAVDPADSQAFQGLFGMVLTVLIALEFKHTMLVVRHHRRAIVQVRAVVLIALLALVRRFIILDLYQTTPTVVAALAGSALALGVVFWLVGNYAAPEEDALQEQSSRYAAADEAKSRRNRMICFHQSRLQRRERP